MERLFGKHGHSRLLESKQGSQSPQESIKTCAPCAALRDQADVGPRQGERPWSHEMEHWTDERQEEWERLADEIQFKEGVPQSLARQLSFARMKGEIIR